MEQEEEWRAVPGWEGAYEVSSLGRLRNRHGRVMSPAIGRRGYRLCALYRAGEGAKMYRLHRLIAMAFIPNPESKEEVNHKDLDKLNNVVSNLEWVTRAENLKHASDRGLFRAITNPKNQQKLSPADVIELRELFAHGVKAKILAAKYGIAQSTVYNTAAGRRRPHG